MLTVRLVIPKSILTIPDSNNMKHEHERYHIEYGIQWIGFGENLQDNPII